MAKEKSPKSYIEDKYEDLNSTHASLLTASLASMKSSDKFAFAKNNYFKADGMERPPTSSEIPGHATPTSSVASAPALFSSATTGSVLFGSTAPALVFSNSDASSPATSATTTTPSALIFPTRSNTVVHQSAKERMVSQASVPVYAEEAVPDDLAREIVLIQNRLQQQEYSFQSIQGEVANLSNRVAQIAISLGMQHIQDGTIYSQASGFALEPDVQFGEMPIFDVYDDETEGSSKQYVDVFAGTPGQQSYEEEQQKCEEALKCFSKPIISPERATDGVFRLTNEKKHDNELIFLCAKKVSDDTFSEEATEFAFPHGRVMLADRSFKLTNEKNNHAPSIVSVQGATVHCGNELPVIHLKKQDVLIDKHDISDSTFDVSFLKSDISPTVPTVAGQQEWDPGIGTSSSMDRWLYWHQDTKFIEIALWLITFYPP